MKTIKIGLIAVSLITSLVAEEQSKTIVPTHERERPTYITIVAKEFKENEMPPDGIRIILAQSGPGLVLDKETISVFDAIEASGGLSRLHSSNEFSITSPIDGNVIHWRGPKLYTPEERKIFLSGIILRRGETLWIPERCRL